jgi:phosphonate transport system substrate-binding protein
MKFLFSLLVILLGFSLSCSDDKPNPVLTIGGIPDQEISRLELRFNTLAEYLSEELDMEVKYIPSVEYAALVTAFQRGDIQLAWFGGLTGVQARLLTPGSIAIAQRPRDKTFTSVFVTGTDVIASDLQDLKGLRFTFGSESSTSGHLMPRFFLTEAGVNPENDFQGPPSYSGSHDKTWKLVEAGSFQAGALNEAVWERANREGSVDTTKIQKLLTTPSYYDYHWVLRTGVDTQFGAGFTDRVTQALLSLSNEINQELLELFQAESFIPTSNSNYQPIETVARELNLVE